MSSHTTVTKGGEFQQEKKMCWWLGRICKLGRDCIIVLLLIYRLLREKDGLPYLTRLSRSRQHTTKVVFAANKVRTQASISICQSYRMELTASLSLWWSWVDDLSKYMYILLHFKFYSLIKTILPSVSLQEKALRQEFVDMLTKLLSDAAVGRTSLDLPFNRAVLFVNLPCW